MVRIFPGQLVACLLLAVPCMVSPSWGEDPSEAELRARAVERCKADRGVDCETPQGLAEWIQQERPITPEQRQAAAAARLHREQCKGNPRRPGC